MDERDYVEIFARLTETHRRETAELRALHAVYRALLEEAGIDAPADEHGAEALRRYRVLFETHGFSDPEQHSELLASWWQRDRV